MTNIQKHIGILGKKVEDRVTGFKGVVTSIAFDLYGCVQATVNPGMGKDGKLADLHWFDVNRLNVLSEKPVMEVPNFHYGKQAEGKQGASEKPSILKP